MSESSNQNIPQTDVNDAPSSSASVTDSRVTDPRVTDSGVVSSRRADPKEQPVAGWWLFPVVLIVLSAFTVGVIRSTELIDPGAANAVTMSVVFGGLFSLCLWCLGGPPWPFIWRVTPLASFLLLGGGFFSQYRVGSVTADLRPQFVRRAAPQHDTTLAALPPQLSEEQPLSEEPPSPLAGQSPRQVQEPLVREFPGFLGDGTGRVLAPPLATDWHQHPPVEQWRTSIGAGWSAFVVSQQRAYTQEQRGEDQLVVCYHLLTGEPIWSYAEKVRYRSILSGDGPRATPAVHDGKVYALGAFGRLVCLDQATGELLWSDRVMDRFGGRLPLYGYSASPLVYDDPVAGILVVAAAGGNRQENLAAYDPAGHLRWTSSAGHCSYSSPVLVTVAGRRQVVIVNESCVSGHDPTTGRTLWVHPFAGANDRAANISQPVAAGRNRLLLTKGYSVGAELVELSTKQTTPGGDTFSTRRVWKTRNLKTKLTSAVRVGEYAYGLDEKILVCLNLNTGQRAWKAGRYHYGQVLAVFREDPLTVASSHHNPRDSVARTKPLSEQDQIQFLLVTSERGEVVLVAADPQGHRELARIQALDDITWNTPTLAGRYLLIRNSREAVCYQLPLARDNPTQNQQPRSEAPAHPTERGT